MWENAQSGKIHLKDGPENNSLRTVRKDLVQLTEASVSFEIFPINQPTERHVINGAFIAKNLGLSEDTYFVKQLQEQYHHLILNNL